MKSLEELKLSLLFFAVQVFHVKGLIQCYLIVLTISTTPSAYCLTLVATPKVR